MDTKITRIKTDGNARYMRFWISDEQALVRLGMYVEALHSNSNVKQYCIIVDQARGETEFLVKTESKFGATLNVNDKLTLSDPCGGYDVSDIPGRSVVCFAGGSGIAAIMPVALNAKSLGAKNVDVFYAETNNTFAFADKFESAPDIHVHRFQTEGALSINPHIPILGMITQLSNAQPIAFMNKPLFYASGSGEFVNRLRSALIPIYAAANDFRVNF